MERSWFPDCVTDVFNREALAS